MSLFDALSTPKWQHKKAEIRLKAVQDLDDQDVLLTLVNSDPNTAVQAAALTRISDSSTLDSLLETLSGNLQAQARQQRLQQLLPQTDQLAGVTDEDLLLRIASLSDDDELIHKAIGQVTNSSRLLEIASTHSLAKIRISAAKAISDIDMLQQLMQNARGHDKGVYRHCKTLVDAHQEQQQLAAEVQEKILQVIAKADELAKAEDSSDYSGRHHAILLQWKLVADTANPSQKETYEAANTICEQRIVAARKAAALAQQEQEELSKARQAFETIQADLDAFASAANLPQDTTALEEMKAGLATFTQRWQTATEATSPSDQQAQNFKDRFAPWNSVLTTLQRLQEQQPRLDKALSQAASINKQDYQALQQAIDRIQKLSATFSWPVLPDLVAPDVLNRLIESKEQLKDQLAELEKNQQKKTENVKSLLQTLTSQLEENLTQDAGKTLSKVRQALAALAPKRRESFELEIRPLSARLNEAHDWKDFAVEPKKIELCASMKALIGSEEDVEILAVKIQSLQEEWKQVGALPHAQEQSLWLEFKAASDEAWKPCKAAFSLQAKQQKQNFDRRMQLIDQLNEYDEKMAWPDSAHEQSTHHTPPDWRMVQKTLDTARAAFKEIRPVNQKAERISQKEFRAVCDRIYAHIKSEYDRNIGRKEALVVSAEKLAEQSDLPKAIDEAKRLQQQWKDVGMTPVGADRKLWTSFRAACDAVFKRLDEQREENKVALNANIKDAEAIRDQAAELVQAQNKSIDPGLPRTLAEMKQQLRDIELPAGVQQRLVKDLYSMEGQVRELAEKARAEQEAAGWNGLLEFIEACAADNAKTESGNAHPVENLPKGVDGQALAGYAQNGPASSEHDEAFLEACIALEVLAEVESPAEDKQARMNYQMKRLVDGIGQQNTSSEHAILNSINKFIALRPDSRFAERFCKTLRPLL